MHWYFIVGLVVAILVCLAALITNGWRVNHGTTLSADFGVKTFDPIYVLMVPLAVFLLWPLILFGIIVLLLILFFEPKGDP